MKNKQVITKIFENWPAKILSLAAAIILFLFFRINTLEERFFSVPLSVRLSDGFVIMNTYPRSVRITLRGQEEEIYTVQGEDIIAYINLEDHQSEGIFKAPVVVNKKGTALNVEPLELRHEPSTITITLEKLVEKNKIEVIHD